MRQSLIPGIHTIFSSGFSFGSPLCRKEFHADWVWLHTISWKIPENFIQASLQPAASSDILAKLRYACRNRETPQCSVSETWKVRNVQFWSVQWYTEFVMSINFDKLKLKTRNLQIQVSCFAVPIVKIIIWTICMLNLCVWRFVLLP